MRKIVLMMSVSLDGYIEGPNREIDWHLVDDEVHQHFNDTLREMGAFLSGRVTYQLMADFWPTADADPASTGPVADFARIWRNMPKIVFSRTLEHAGWHTTIVRDLVVEDIHALKAQEGGDLALGGADLAAEFMRHDLVDEYRVYVHPVLLGRGKRLFPETDTLTPLRLTESRTFGNGVALLRYEHAESTAAAAETAETAGAAGTDPAEGTARTDSPNGTGS
ncbi:dihydrofolate reductase family protein [Streptomyces avermitilis]|uniref:dihydrofolate reductase family protein n=1 Tax=Streptomyces avermitilis TaxID=33903 RepID=UPI0036A2C593